MSQLSNLVPDPANKDNWVPRPGAVVMTGTQVFSPGFVSCLYVAGRYAYGMVSSALNAGKDQPFAYDILAGSYIAITGITNANTPNSPLTSGAWTPPTMDLIGVYVVVTHPGFNGAGNGYFGWINVANPNAPTWASGNMATNPLLAPATFVKQFSQRAYFAVAQTGSQPGTFASDVLNPLLASYQLGLTFGDNKPIAALGALGLHTITGGVVQSLLVFKDNNVFQVVGDFGATGTIGSIGLNSLNVAVGTTAPLSVVATPRGVAFLSQDGFRIIDWDGKVSDPIGIAGTGMVVPFTNALVPSRVAAGCNGQTIRAMTQNNAAPGQPFQEWVFDLERKIWHGPHTFPYGRIASYGVSYVVTPIGVTGLWQSDIIPSTGSQYSENGVALTWTWQTALLANQDSVYEQAIVESTIYCSADGLTGQFTVTAESMSGEVLDSVSVQPPESATAKWGSAIWGQSTWGSANLQMSNMIIPWDQPIVFDRVRFTMRGLSAPIAIGQMRVILETLEYMALPG
jgi:hypothetical protein